MDYRPIYHYTAKKGWINDPNGLFFYKGKYHLCCQHNPTDITWGNLHWGHATSDDLIKWEHKDEAISPTEDYQCFSGSAIVDYENTSALKEGEDAPILLFFTAYPKGQFMSYSTDGGESFKVYGPVLPNDSSLKDFKKLPYKDLPDAGERDPKVLWCEEAKKWIMIVYTEVLSRTHLPAYSIYSSKNLLDWVYESEVPYCFEVPDMFRLPVDGGYKYVIVSANGDYRVGDFDGHEFVPCQEINKNQRLFDGCCYYTWNNMGKISQTSWLYTDYDYSPEFKNSYTLPVDLSLRYKNGRYELLREPVAGLEKYKKEIFSLEGGVFKGGENPFPKGFICPEACEIDVDMEYDPFSITSLQTGCGSVWYCASQKSLVYNRNPKELWHSGIPVDLEPVENRVKFKVFADKNSIEIFGDEGFIYMPFAAKWESRELSLTPILGKQTIRSLKVYEIKV